MSSEILREDIKKVATTLAPFAEALKRRHILLTGGTGFIGKWLLHSFLELRHAYGLDIALTVLSRDPGRFLADYPEFATREGLDFITGDVRAFTLFPGRVFDYVIHGATAASARLENENPEEMYSVITEGTRHILEIARQCSVRRFLFISSGAVYGPQSPSLSHIPETFDGAPVTAYGKGKKVSEQLCIEASADRFECVIARPFAFVGPYLPLDAHFAIGNFIRDCLQGRPIVIQSDGTPLRSYLYAADLAEWLWTILLRGEHARPYNVGAPDAISICDLAHCVRECAGTQNEIVIHGHKVEGALPARYVPSVDRARKELGLVLRCTLEDAVIRTLQWHKDVISK